MRPPPQAAVDHACALLHMPSVHRGLAYRLDLQPGGMPREYTHGDRRVGRSKGGGANGRDRLAQLLSEQCQPDHIAGLALVGAHA